MVFLCPQGRDRRELARLDSGQRVEFVGDDLESVDHVDVDTLTRECAGHAPRAVVGTKDRSALLAAIVSERLGLGGPTPTALIACQHKLRSRELQREIVPAATPAFEPVVDVDRLTYPCFVKPVVGRLSDEAVLARSPADLAALEPGREYARVYEEIASQADVQALECSGYLAEEVLSGAEVTLEGFVAGGSVEVMGITDSVNYPGTASFERFEYPTALSGSRCEELASVAEALMPALGFDQGLFNIEFFVPDDGSAKIVEVNARMASQFAPLLEHVHGRSSYRVLVELAAGDRPAWPPRLERRFALSYCLRVFDDACVTAVPQVGEHVELLVEPGELLSRQGTNDPDSYRLCIFPQKGTGRDETLAAARERAAALRKGFVLS